jgi:hypothetical protein
MNYGITGEAKHGQDEVVRILSQRLNMEVLAHNVGTCGYRTSGLIAPTLVTKLAPGSLVVDTYLAGEELIASLIPKEFYAL